MGTAASEPRCRCVYLHHGLDPLSGSTACKGVATMTEPLKAGSASCRVTFVVRFSGQCGIASGSPSPQAEIGETSGPSATGGTTGGVCLRLRRAARMSMSSRSPHYSNARKKEVLACRFLLLTSKSPCKEAWSKRASRWTKQTGYKAQAPDERPTYREVHIHQGREA